MSVHVLNGKSNNRMITLNWKQMLSFNLINRLWYPDSVPRNYYFKFQQNISFKSVRFVIEQFNLKFIHVPLLTFIIALCNKCNDTRCNWLKQAWLIRLKNTIKEQCSSFFIKNGKKRKKEVKPYVSIKSVFFSETRKKHHVTIDEYHFRKSVKRWKATLSIG